MKMQQFRKRLMMLGIKHNLENSEANSPPERNSAVAELRRATCRARRGPSTQGKKNIRCCRSRNFWKYDRYDQIKLEKKEELIIALSNWDTLSFNEKGEPVGGIFRSPMGVDVEIYKNWIYIKDKAAWQKGAYAEPFIMEIWKSELCYKDVHVVSDFVENSIFVAAWSGWMHENTLKGMVGCGVYGFDSNGEYVGVTRTHLSYLKLFLESKYPFKERIYFIIPNSLKDIELENGKRFNQGDMFFHKEIGTNTQCSTIGKAEEPVMMKILKSKDE